MGVYQDFYFAAFCFAPAVICQKIARPGSG